MKQLNIIRSLRSGLSLIPLAILVILALGLTLSACTTAPATAPATGSSASKVEAKPAGQASGKAKPKPADQTPKYGGIIHLTTTDPPSWDDPNTTDFGPQDALLAETLLVGNWTKGPGGGFGTNDTDWATFSYDTMANKTGQLAESWKIDIDKEKQQATVVFKIRPGVHYALDRDNEASKLVGGREVTADDVMAAIKAVTTDKRAFIYRANPELRNVDARKTGPLEVTLHLPLSNLVSAMSRLGGITRIFPSETRDKLADWKSHVGSGPFMLTNYVAGSTITYVKNPNYWMKDPVGPGEGNQLPYLDGVEYFIIPDASTRLTAFRTGKIDVIDTLDWEDAAQLKKEFPQMPNAGGQPQSFGSVALYMRTDRAPFNDIRVRRALFMATDFNAIKQDIDGGLGHIITFPFDYFKGYSALHVGVNDPDLPASVKELFTYNPEKAKQLLAGAGLPNGFKTSLLTTSSTTSYYEAIAAMWAKVGITLALDVQTPGVQINLLNTQKWDGLSSGMAPPAANFYLFNHVNGTPGAGNNQSFVNDAHIKAALPNLRILAATDEKAAMQQGRELAKYVLEQAWVIPVPSFPSSTFWWPWLKNYSGEYSVGYHTVHNWTKFVWIDQDLKKSMGH